MIEELGVFWATFYNKVKKRSFNVTEMVKLGTIFFPEETKTFEIKEALKTSREDSKAGRIKTHAEVIAKAGEKLLQ